MKKILSIILALGLVLGISVAAMPVGAQPPPWGTDWTVVNVSVDPDCEFTRATYNITFEAPATLTQGYHSITVRFPAGTGYPATWRAGHIRIQDSDMVSPVNVFVSEITRVGDEVTFLVPTTTVAGPLLVQFQPVYAAGSWSGIVNPAAGRYTLDVKTSRAPMSTWVRSGWSGPLLGFVGYLIAPTTSDYEWVLDFDKVGGYEGIGRDVIPPFQRCGQENFGFQDGDRWVTEFDLFLEAARVGCTPCPDMAAVMVMLARPSTTARAHLYEDQVTAFNFTSTTPNTAGNLLLLNIWPLLGVDPDDVWEFGLHFDTPGTYTFALVLVSLADETECELECATVMRIIDFQVYQEKDSYRIDPFTQKWNFFSSPLILKDSSIEVVLGALLDVAAPQLRHVVHYDNALDKWFGFFPGSNLPTEYQSLTTIEDGKAYAIRMRADYEGFNSAFVPYLWLFGNEEPEFPAPPLSYQVYEGWTMMGFTSTAAMPFEDYLYPSVVGAGAAWHFGFLAPGANMNPGFGYWVYFNADGTVVPGVA